MGRWRGPPYPARASTVSGPPGVAKKSVPPRSRGAWGLYFFDMPRPVTPKKPSEHLMILARMWRSIEIDPDLDETARARITTAIDSVMGALRAEVRRCSTNC